MPPSTSSYTMFGVVFAFAYASDSAGAQRRQASPRRGRARCRGTAACPVDITAMERAFLPRVGSSDRDHAGFFRRRNHLLEYSARRPSPAPIVTSSAMWFTVVVRTTIVVTGPGGSVSAAVGRSNPRPGSGSVPTCWPPPGTPRSVRARPGRRSGCSFGEGEVLGDELDRHPHRGVDPGRPSRCGIVPSRDVNVNSGLTVGVAASNAGWVVASTAASQGSPAAGSATYGGAVATKSLRRNSIGRSLVGPSIDP